MILSSIVIWLLASAVVSVGIGLLLAWKRRQERAVNDFSEQLRQLTSEAGSLKRIGLEGRTEGLTQLGTAVNKLLENLE